jgi:hypothetical protein
MDQDFIEAYNNTNYMIPIEDIIIRIGEENTKLDALLKKHNANSYAFITAHNPKSVVLSEEENNIRHNQLKQCIKDYLYWEGEGIGSDPAWKPEKSLLILAITKADAMKIGTKFEQNAIIYGRINEQAELLNLFDY